jgi:hypothetical protein
MLFSHILLLTRIATWFYRYWCCLLLRFYTMALGSGMPLCAYRSPYSLLAGMVL